MSWNYTLPSPPLDPVTSATGHECPHASVRATRLVPRASGLRVASGLPKSLLIKHIHVKLPIHIPRRDRRPLRINRPLHSDNRWITLRDILDISKGQILSNLLLQSHRRLRRIRRPRNLRIDLEFTHPEQPL